jgi:uncharacterized protein YijF (DUF1287 family)
MAAHILEGARAEVANETRYENAYHVIDYPGGDVPADSGVCTDLVIRAVRHAGIDLQRLLHEDRVAHPDAYPTHIWDYKKPDRNIDHRRCQNLVAWFERYADSLTISTDRGALHSWQPGDIVFYVRETARYPWHVALVSDRRAFDGMPLIIDGYPPKTEEVRRLDELAPIHSHFRLRPAVPLSPLHR